MRLRERVEARRRGESETVTEPSPWRGRLKRIGTVLQFTAFALLILEVFRLLESGFATPNYTLIMIYAFAFLAGRIILAGLAVTRF